MCTNKGKTLTDENIVSWNFYKIKLIQQCLLIRYSNIKIKLTFSKTIMSVSINKWYKKYKS